MRASRVLSLQCSPLRRITRRDLDPYELDRHERNGDEIDRHE